MDHWVNKPRVIKWLGGPVSFTKLFTVSGHNSRFSDLWTKQMYYPWLSSRDTQVGTNEQYASGWQHSPCSPDVPFLFFILLFPTLLSEFSSSRLLWPQVWDWGSSTWPAVFPAYTTPTTWHWNPPLACKFLEGEDYDCFDLCKNNAQRNIWRRSVAHSCLVRDNMSYIIISAWHSPRYVVISFTLWAL